MNDPRYCRPIFKRHGVPFYPCVHQCGRAVPFRSRACGECIKSSTVGNGESLRDFRKRVIEKGNQ